MSKDRRFCGSFIITLLLDATTCCNLLQMAAPTFSGGNTKIESGDENDNQHGLIHYEHPDLPDNDYKIETEAPDTMLPSKGYIKKALENVKLAFKFVGTYDMRNAPPTDVLVGNVYVHLRDIPKDNSDPYEENVGDVMHPGWVNAWNTEGLADGAIHPLPRTMEKAFLGDFLGAGVNWWAKIGKVDDIGPEDLLQNLESVLTKGNDSTKGLTLGCDDPGEGNDPDPSTAKIVLDNSGTAEFAGTINTKGSFITADAGTVILSSDGKFTSEWAGNTVKINTYDSPDSFYMQAYPTANPSDIKFSLKNDGSAEFASTVDINDRLRVYEATTSPGNTLFAVQSDLGGTRATQASILSNGSAEFKGNVTCGRNTLFPSGTSYLGIAANNYALPVKNTNFFTQAVGGEENWIGFMGAYGLDNPTDTKVGILLQSNVNGVSEGAGYHIQTIQTGVATSKFVIGRMYAASTASNGTDQQYTEDFSIGQDGTAEFAGQIETKSGGIKFPDGTVQTTAGGNTDQFLLKDFSSYPSITSASTVTTADEPADEIEIETSTY